MYAPFGSAVPPLKCWTPAQASACTCESEGWVGILSLLSAHSETFDDGFETYVVVPPMVW